MGNLVNNCCQPQNENSAANKNQPADLAIVKKEAQPKSPTDYSDKDF